MSIDALIKSLFRAASLARRRWRERLAVPENVAREDASTSMNPRSTSHIRITRIQTAFCLIHMHVHTYVEVSTFCAVLTIDTL